MPFATGSAVAPSSHCAHFYSSESDLLAAIEERLVRPALAGEAVVCIATREHTAAIRDAFVERGVDVEAAEAAGRLVLLDATETLDRLLVDGAPDAAAFDRVVGDVVRGAGSDERPVHAFGEMVAVLWAAGDVVSAIDLEALWNELGERVPFSLLCGYPIGDGGDPRADESFLEVCSLHTEVVGAAPAPPGFDVVRRFARTTTSPRQARRLVTEILEAWELPELVVDAQVAVTELVANAVVHARSDVTVSLRNERGVVRLAVGDGSSRPPEPRDPGASDLGGRGLRLIAGVADEWDYDVLDDGKLVWVDLDPAAARGTQLP